MATQDLSTFSILEEISDDIQLPVGNTNNVDDVDDVDIDEENIPGEGAENSEEERSYITPDFVPVEDTRTPYEKIVDLLEQMAPCRRLMMSILSLCKDPLPVEKVNQYIDDFRQEEFTVFSAASISAQLEKAGALVRITEKGEPFAEIDTTPKVVVVDGVEFLEAAEAPVPYWKTSEDGLAVLADNNPLERIRALFNEDEKYLPVYKTLLVLAEEPNGITAQQVTGALINNPLLKDANLLPAHFLEKLEKCEALVWKKAWKTSEFGKKILEDIKDIEAIFTELPEIEEISDEQAEDTFIDPMDSLEY